MFSVVIVMAGKGTRLGLKENKALALIDDKPMFLYSYQKFIQYSDDVILVVNKDDYDTVKKLVPEATLVVGGQERFNSVYNGIIKCKYDYVMIHDAARPFISSRIILDVAKNLLPKNEILVATKVTDTIRDIHEFKVLDRNNLIQAQTPQAFNRLELIKAYDQAIKDNIEITDDITVMEKYNKANLIIVDGEAYNFKVTTLSDLKMAIAIKKGGLLDND